MGCYNYSNGLFEIQVKLPKKLGTYNPSVFQCSKDNQWMTELLLHGKLVLFKIDTGADITAISEEIF